MAKEFHTEAIQHPIFKLIGEASDELGVDSYVIGGFVRDYFLKRNTPKDIDIVAIGSGIELAKKVASKLKGKPEISVFKNFGTAMIKHKDLELEFVGARKESYNRDSRKPIVEDGTLEDDQNRRDFTINAMALTLNQENFGKLLDPFGGLADLDKEIIRTPLEPGITYSDDPLRMMRAIRFATQLHFTIELQSLQAITENKDRIKIVSKERIVDELHKILMSSKPSVGFKLMHQTELLPLILPELTALQGIEEKEGQRHKDNFWHTLEVVDNIAKTTDNLWLRWAALLHDIGKAPTKKFHKKIGWTFHAHEFVGSKMVYKLFKRLRMPLNEKMKFVQKMVLMSSRPIILSEDHVTDSAVRRLVFDAGDAVEDLMTLCEADITTKNPRKQKKYKNNFKIVRQKIVEVEERDHIRNFQPPVSGEEIMKTFNLKPSKEIGVIKDAIKEAILEGEIPNEYEAAYNFMLEKGKKMNLKVHSE
ncbi:polynucleotide adenylyltransferase/metal dependent phosphohydrolase [Allomuricauda ruestringensis DSM 13258]|uniref:Polynucleotide adenylyltransferase/metal dependent phosphohydrolase n=1 Tax=Allomuricauda ruestringensis (strain DSM 13258 / CIP 107369 / LMG 19739 / B1) TaxID=886377 RepID=G2PRE9_ALLRU|nr:HD domain-containing protein [Allomuricauda ruestringensis]AEM69398.1 polynucleotide adenylyltransferase/metal dependent phosphohydrolase [Allomuricauda ruestringensis DSM 13258]